jgi:ABC-type lipoprotein export system ATPase subunit
MNAPPHIMPLTLHEVRLHPEAPPITLTVGSGECFAVLGGNGSGKSRLLAAILGQFDSGGEINIFGIPVHRKSTRRRALANVGSLFQESGLLRDLTVQENIALPGRVRGEFDTAANETDVTTLLELLDCQHIAANYPSELSAGEARRVALARAIAGDSRILLADEPVAGLSGSSRADVVALLRALLAEGVLDAIVLFTEDRQVASALASRTLTLERRRNIFGLHSQPDPAQ